jgi:uncharacterized protein
MSEKALTSINQLPSTSGEVNRLFPVFIKLEQLKVLIVGGGYVGNEKLEAILNNSPQTVIKIVAISISEQIQQLVAGYPGVTLVQKAYEKNDMADADIVFSALNDAAVSAQVSADARQAGKLVNVADKPALCDFYLSSVVQKGNLKIAISTNGKSPTVAKRVKELLNDALPGELDELLDHMQQIRNRLTGDFTDKVKQLNDITKILSADK